MEIGTFTITASALPLLLVEEPIPQHNSLLAGRMYYKEVMKSQSYRRFMNVARINKETSLLLKKNAEAEWKSRQIDVDQRWTEKS